MRALARAHVHRLPMPKRRTETRSWRMKRSLHSESATVARSIASGRRLTAHARGIAERAPVLSASASAAPENELYCWWRRSARSNPGGHWAAATGDQRQRHSAGVLLRLAARTRQPGIDASIGGRGSAGRDAACTCDRGWRQPQSPKAIQQSGQTLEKVIDLRRGMPMPCRPESVSQQDRSISPLHRLSGR